MLFPSRVAGRTLDIRGPDLARGPEVARRWCRWRVQDDLVETGVDGQTSGGDLGRYLFESAGGL